jgi:hypothetical protein
MYTLFSIVKIIKSYSFYSLWYISINKTRQVYYFKIGCEILQKKTTTDLSRIVILSIYYSSIISTKEMHQTDNVIFHSFVKHDLKGVFEVYRGKSLNPPPASDRRDRHF